MTKIPPDDFLQGLCKLRIRGSEKLKTVLELYDMEIRQKKIWPDYHRLRKAKGQCVKGDVSSFRLHDSKRGNVTQSSILTPRPQTQHDGRERSKEKSPRGRGVSGKRFQRRFRNYLNENNTNRSWDCSALLQIVQELPFCPLEYQLVWFFVVTLETLAFDCNWISGRDSVMEGQLTTYWKNWRSHVDDATFLTRCFFCDGLKWCWTRCDCCIVFFHISVMRIQTNADKRQE